MLLLCPDCRLGISSEAPQCPHCGRMLTPEDIDRQKALLARQTRWVKRVFPWLALVAIGVGVLAVGVFFRLFVGLPMPWHYR